jgi:hypothetical protein
LTSGLKATLILRDRSFQKIHSFFFAFVDQMPAQVKVRQRVRRIYAQNLSQEWFGGSISMKFDQSSSFVPNYFGICNGPAGNHGVDTF